MLFVQWVVLVKHLFVNNYLIVKACQRMLERRRLRLWGRHFNEGGHGPELWLGAAPGVPGILLFFTV